jgi:hypothetical protein
VERPMTATIASSSPLVAHDQRLNIPGFAAAPPPVDTSAPGGLPAESVGALPFARASAVLTHVEREVIVSESVRSAPFEGSSRGSPTGLTPFAAALPSAATTSSVMSSPVTRSSPALEPSHPESKQLGTRSESRPTADASAEAERGPRSRYVNENPDPIERAFAAADAWLRSPRAERGPAPRLEATTRREPLSARQRPERPGLTIGSINVEVISAPAVPTMHPASVRERREFAHRTRSSGTSGFGPRSSFGWRQR